MALFEAVCLYKKGRCFFFRFGQRVRFSSFPCHFFLEMCKERFCKTKTCLHHITSLFFKEHVENLERPVASQRNSWCLNTNLFNSAGDLFWDGKNVSLWKTATGFLQTSGIKFGHGLKLNEHHGNLRDATPKQIAGLLKRLLTTNVP